jgi:hypothetical protein
MLLAGVVSLWSIPALAQAVPDRMTDKDVKALIEKVDEGRDKFEGNLDGKLKDSILRNETKEVNVSAALQDYQDNIKKLQERFTEDYSASAEVAVVLRQAARFDTFMQTTPSVTKGRSEWEHHVADLKHLAVVYGAMFPLSEGIPVRRMNDKEAAKVADDLKEAADRVKGEFDKRPVATLPKPDKDAIKKDLELLIKQADAVKSRTEDHKPATAEARQVVAQVAVVQKFIDAHPAPTPAPMPNWEAVQTSLGKLEQAFGLTK